MAAFKFNGEDRRITGARVAFGGMAATPKRASACEAALASADLDNVETWQSALNALTEDFQPLTDMRASAEYRMQTAQGLLRRALLELSAGCSLRVTGTREVAA